MPFTLALRPLKKLLYTLFFLCCVSRSFGQDRQIQGIVYDRDSKQRLTRVYIYNTRTEKGFFNNSKGEFTTTARNGDVLVAALEGYLVDTVKVQTQNTLLIYLKRSSIRLREVIVRDTSRSPDEQLKETKEAFGDAYRRGSTKDMLKTGGSDGMGGAGLSIDALYNLLSREGRNARQLQKIIERDYRESMISYRFNRSLVSDVTKLKGDTLTDFMQQYRPSYNFVIEASDYELMRFIKASYERYQQNPAAYRLPPLKP